MSETGTLLPVAELLHRGRALEPPFRLEFKEASGKAVVLDCEAVLRLLPNRRLVARCTHEGRVRVLKLFIGDKSERYFEREHNGVLAFAEAGIATPELCGTVRSADGSARGLLFEHLSGAQAIADVDTDAVDQIAAALGLLHGAGYWHSDLHLNNFVKDRAQRVFAIDGDGVRRGSAGALSRRRSLDNLALLLAQLPPLQDARLRAPVAAYAAARGWQPPPQEEIATLTRKQRRRRTHNYLKKVQRSCTEFHFEQRFSRVVICDRACWLEPMQAFADDPEAVFGGSEVLKAGNSATVIRARIGSEVYVVKRYNIKNFWHGLRRALKPRARFRLAWCNGHALAFLSIPTARPVCLVEKRFGPLKGVAYLVMRDNGDRDLASEVAAHGVDESLLADVTRSLAALEAAELVHGDMKATNFLLGGEGAALVDLDAMHEGPLAPDLRRFLANWDHAPEVRAQFERSLAEAGLLPG